MTKYKLQTMIKLEESGLVKDQNVPYSFPETELVNEMKYVLPQLKNEKKKPANATIKILPRGVTVLTESYQVVYFFS